MRGLSFWCSLCCLCLCFLCCRPRRRRQMVSSSESIFLPDVARRKVQILLRKKGMIGLLWSIGEGILCSVTRPLWHLFWFLWHLYVSVWSAVLNWLSIILWKPAWLLTAFRDKKELELQLHVLQTNYEVTTLQNGQLQKKLESYMRDRRRTIGALESEKETAIALRNRVKELEQENQHLLENERYLKRGFAEATAKVLLTTATLDAKGKPLELAKLDLRLDTQLDELQFEEGDANLDTEDELLQLEKRGSDLTLLQAKDVASNSPQGNLIQWGCLQPGYLTHSSIDHPRSLFRSDSKEFKDVGSPLVVESEQEVAFASSVFSAMLLTLVAVISLEAKDPCAPLRNALLMVVALSLANVVKFFTKVESRQGIYAVALISLNFFMLGTLAYPSLPYVGRFASVVFWSIGGRILKLFGFESLRMSNLELQQSIERT